MKLAKIARQRYDPARHDPGVLLPDFEAALAKLAQDPAMADLVRRQTGAVGVLKRRLEGRPAVKPSVLDRMKRLLPRRR